MNARKEIIDHVSKLLLTDAPFALEFLELLLKAQTFDERRDRTTRHPNGEGFNVVDAKQFTKLAQDALARGYLTPEEQAVLRRSDKHGRPVLSRYWRQALPLLERRELRRLPKMPMLRELTSKMTRVQAL